MSLEEWELGRRYFSSLPKAMLCLYMSIANGVSWEQVIIPLNAVSVVWDFMFLFYIAFATLADAHIEKIRMLFSEIDEDASGVITYQMFEKGIRSQDVKMLGRMMGRRERRLPPFALKMETAGLAPAHLRTYFESIDLDVWDAWTFFKLLDMDSGGAVEIEEFLMGCLRLRGNAKAMDIAKLCHDQTWLIREQARFWEFVEDELNHLHSGKLQAGTSTTSAGVVGSGGAGGLQNLIRAYQVRGHEAAELDPLGLHAWRKWTDKAITSGRPCGHISTTFWVSTSVKIQCYFL
eukprot:s2528_g29.t4